MLSLWNVIDVRDATSSKLMMPDAISSFRSLQGLLPGGAADGVR
jgi:hypothetical protein